MHRLLASVGRLLLVLALVLTGPGLSARAMAATHGHGGHAAVVAADAAGTVQHEAPKSACHDMATPSHTVKEPSKSRAHAAVHADQHGPMGRRRYAYEPTFLLRGLTELHIEFTPSA